MNIENINNIQNINNNWIARPINRAKIKHIITTLLFFIFIFITICLITYRLYINNNSFTHLKMQKYVYKEEKSDYSKDLKRGLDFFYYKKNLSSEDIKEKMNKDFSFIINITSNQYIGNWTDLSYKDNDFFDDNIKNGVAELYFHKMKYNPNSILAKNRINSFKIDVIIREGKYIDKYIKINFTFYMDYIIEKYLDEEETFIFQNTNNILDFYRVEYLIGRKKETIIKANASLILSKKDHIYDPTFKQKNFSPFDKVKLVLTSKDLNITIDTKIYNNENEKQEVRMYSFILILLGVMEIYYCSKLIMKINNQHEIARKISLITIAINCCFKIVICIIHFFLSLSTTDEDMSYQFGLITVIYFFSFVGFELKLLLLVFRIRHEGVGNREMYRRRLLTLYLMFYVGFSFIFFNIKVCLTNFYLILFVYIISWLSQILFSICTNSRPPMSRLYIVWLSLSRLFFPVYVKGIDNNYFDLKPSYFKVLSLVIIIFIEAMTLILQKSLGPRIMIPKKFNNQNQVFDYYKDKVNIEKHVSQNPICVICLENLAVDVDENLNIIKKKKKPKNLGAKVMSILYLDVLNAKMKKCIKYIEGKNLKKKYMITPCDHVYHSVCLEKWMKYKNECPYCKSQIPSID